MEFALLWSEYAAEYQLYVLCMLTANMQNAFSRVLWCAFNGNINCLAAHWGILVLAAVLIAGTIGLVVSVLFYYRRRRATRIAVPGDERPAVKVD